MRKKISEKKQNPRGGEGSWRGKAQSSVVANTDSPPKQTIRVADVEMPPPAILLEEAEREPNFRDLAAYHDVISTLRGKAFSYREIAEWLQECGAPVDHNEVYRVYTKRMSDYEAAMGAREADEIESPAGDPAKVILPERRGLPGPEHFQEIEAAPAREGIGHGRKMSKWVPEANFFWTSLGSGCLQGTDRSPFRISYAMEAIMDRM